jgi:WD40 repeat protein
MRVLNTAPGEVLDVAFSPDCRAIVAAVKDTGLFLWNLDSPTIAPVRLAAERYRTGSLTFSPSSRQLAWLTTNGRRVYDRDTRTAAHEHAAPGFSLIGSDDSRGISNAGLPDYVLAGWQLKEGEWVRQWQLSTRELFVGSLTLAPAFDQFAMFTRAAENDPWRLEIRDAATAAFIATGNYPYSYAGKLAFHPHGEQIAGLNDMTLLAWSLPCDGNLRLIDPRLIRNDSRKHFTALAYHPDGRHLFVTSNDKTVHVFDTQTLDRINRYTWQLDELSTVAVSTDGTLAAAGSANGDVVVWDLE